ncbi:MAG: tetratricopeptide repeat protein [Spirochaetes bacterium]|nr:tetratricopeptide repeat protein [Spirochaetota bacterium]
MFKKYVSLGLFVLLPVFLFALEMEESVFTRGLNYYIRREFKLAAEEWKNLLDQNPNHTRAKTYMEKAYNKYNQMEINFYKGLHFFLKEQYCESIPFFKNTLMINPRHEKALNHIKIAYNLCKELMDKKQLAAEMVKEAQEYQKEEEFSKAIALYKLALLLDPDNQQAKVQIIRSQSEEMEYNKNLELMLHLQAGREYHNQKRYLEAIQEWSKALMIDEDNQEAKQMLELDKKLLKDQQLKEKINHLISRGIESYINRQYNESKEAFEQVLNLDPENETAKEYLAKINDILEKLSHEKTVREEAEKHFSLGLAYFNKEEYEPALEEFTITLEIMPDHTKAKEYRDRTLALLKKLQKKREEEKSSLTQELLAKGIKYYQMGEYEMAIDMFKQVIQIDPENKYAQEYLRLALQALQLKKESDITEDSPYYIIVKNLEKEGLDYLARKEYDLAQYYFDEIKEIFPLNKMANRNLLKIMYVTDKDKVADILDAHFQKGKEHYNSKDYLRALYEFQLVKDINPAYPEINSYIARAKNPPSLYARELKRSFNLGLYHYSKKEYQKAIEQWKKVIELDRSPLSNKYIGDCLSNIAKAQYRIKAEKGILVTDSEIVSETSKTQKTIKKHYYLGVAHYTSGNYQEALAEWEKVIKLDPYHAGALKNIKKVKEKLESAK